MSSPAPRDRLDAPLPQGEHPVPGKAPGRSEPLLAGSKLLRSLDAEALHAIEGAGSCRRYRPLEHIIDRDSRTTDVFFIVRGQARILNYSVTGRERSTT